MSGVSSPEMGADQAGMLNEDQKRAVQGVLNDIENDLGRLRNLEARVDIFRRHGSSLKIALRGTPLEDQEPFSTIIYQLFESGVVSRSVGGVDDPPKFDEEKLSRAVAEAKGLVG